MKPNEPNDSLSRTLAAWRVAPASDPNFRPAVWRRINRRARESWPAYLRAHVAGWSVAAALAVAAAGWAGHAAARARLAAERDRMVVAYLGAIDPRVMAVARSATP